ncbi:MAG TPA: hypothetical protein VKS00_00120 [Candidatus Acidoferrales bacterium]|nr:hypothetical protein [Candidatus Acidoferrales bacterium]
MKQAHCNLEEKIAVAIRTGQWSDALLAHVADCHACEEVAVAASYLCESSHAAGLNAALPDASRIWWKAQVAANVEVIEKALRPIVWVRRVAFGAGAAVLVAAVVAWWPRLARFFGSFAGVWTRRDAAPSAGHENLLFLITAMFLLILLPLIFGLYAAWSED